MGTTMTSTIIISDRKEGVWDRSIVAGVTSLEIMFTHFITQFILMVLQVAEIMVITFAIYNTTNEGSLSTLVFMIILEGLCGMSYGNIILI